MSTSVFIFGSKCLWFSPMIDVRIFYTVFSTSAFAESLQFCLFYANFMVFPYSAFLRSPRIYVFIFYKGYHKLSHLVDFTSATLKESDFVGSTLGHCGPWLISQNTVLATSKNILYFAQKIH